MYPNPANCPANVYNLWQGFAAEKMDRAYDAVRAGLLLILMHLAMLCD